MAQSQFVTVVGGGPAGIAATRALLAESPNFHVRILEARPNFGGLWNYSPVYGPMYRNLDANVPRDLIGFTDFPFPGQGVDKSYPSRQEVLNYIRSYSREVTRDRRVTVSFNTKVVSVVKDSEHKKWVTTTVDGELIESDYLVVSTGHYEHPYWPDIPGLKSHSGSIHSVDYDTPDEFAGKRVLVLGNSRSGTDILIQLLSRAAPIAVSRREEHSLDGIFDEDPGSVIWKPEVQKVIGHAVYFKDGTCEIYDRLVVCTGYLYEFPYLSQYEPGKLQLLDPHRQRLHNMYRHTIFAGDPTLATLGMNKGMVPFPTFETQGEVIAGAWSGRLRLPELSEILAEEEANAKAATSNEKFHDFTKAMDVDFMQSLWDWSDEAPGGGLRVSRWDAKKIEWRKNAGASKVEQDVENLLRSKRLRESLLRG